MQRRPVWTFRTPAAAPAGFSASATIDRNDFGVDIDLPLDGGGVVAAVTVVAAGKVQISLEIEAALCRA